MKGAVRIVLIVAVLGLLTLPVDAKNVWGSRKSKGKQKKTQFEQLNENYLELDSMDDQESSTSITGLLELAMGQNLDAIEIVSQLFDSFASQFKSEETVHFFNTFKFSELLRGMSDGYTGGEDLENNDVMKQLLSVPGRELHGQGVGFVEQIQTFFTRLKNSRGSKRKLAKLLGDLPVEVRPAVEMLIELDSTATRSILAGAVSSLQPMEQLMLNKVLSGDISGFLSLWKQHLMKDGELEKVRKFLLEHVDQLPDPYSHIVEDKDEFEKYAFEMFNLLSSDLGISR